MWQDWINDIQAKKFKPIYFLTGDESYFIDKIVEAIEQNVLSEEEKAFNQLLVYASDTKPDEILSRAFQYPMGAEYNLIIVKEAQHWNREWEKFADYAESPSPHSIVCFVYKSTKVDKRKKFFKTLSKQKALYESKSLYDNQLPAFLDSLVKSYGLKIEPLAAQLMTENIGSNLNRMDNEVKKLKLALPKDSTITTKIIEEQIGISRTYNNFEFNKAVGTRNHKDAFKIAKYFGENPKDHPLIVTLSTLANYFSNLLIYHSLSDKSPRTVASELKINPFFVKEYVQASKYFPIKKIAPILSLIRQTDVRLKGIGATQNTSEDEHLRELLIKIFTV